MRKNIAEEPRESALASGWTVEAAGEPEPAAADAETQTDADAEPQAEAEQPGQLSNLALVLFGVVGGLYLLYAWIWLSWAQFYASQNSQVAEGSGSLGSVLQQIVFWAAPLAPVLWFAAAMLLNRGSMRKTVLWLGIGAVLLVPLPVFSGGGS